MVVLSLMAVVVSKADGSIVACFKTDGNLVLGDFDDVRYEVRFSKIGEVARMAVP